MACNASSIVSTKPEVSGPIQRQVHRHCPRRSPVSIITTRPIARPSQKTSRSWSGKAPGRRHGRCVNFGIFFERIYRCFSTRLLPGIMGYQYTAFMSTFPRVRDPTSMAVINHIRSISDPKVLQGRCPTIGKSLPRYPLRSAVTLRLILGPPKYSDMRAVVEYRRSYSFFNDYPRSCGICTSAVQGEGCSIMSVSLQFCGAAKTVTGSCYWLTTDSCSPLVDFGMFQGTKTIKELNYGEFPFVANEIDFVSLTHAHTDHAGLLPKLCKAGFPGQPI
mgnify:CR=1 FL=1